VIEEVKTRARRNNRKKPSLVRRKNGSSKEKRRISEHASGWRAQTEYRRLNSVDWAE
jgi:hypothetical protein